MKNYYKILGVRMSAPSSEIKGAYRKLAKLYHPDLNPGNKRAEERFTDINEAYEVLSDAARRGEYDTKVTQALAGNQAAVKYAPPNAFNTQQAQAAYAAQNAYARSSTGADKRRSQNGYAYQNNANPYANAQYGQNANPYGNAQYANPYNGGQAGYQNNAQQGADAFYANQTIFQQTYEQAFKMAETAQQTGYNKGYIVGFDVAKKNYVPQMEALKKQNEELVAKLKESEEKITAAENEVKAAQENLKANEESAKKRAEQMLSHEKLSAAQARKLADELNTQLKKSVAQLTYREEKFKETEDRLKKAEMEIKRMEMEIKHAWEVKEELEIRLQQWEQFNAKQQNVELAERHRYEMEVKQKDAKKRCKNTLYGTLGVAFWAEDEEISESFKKLVKRYQKKAEGGDDASKEKLYAVNLAYKTLINATTRHEYNITQGFTDEEIKAEREFKKTFDETINNLDQQIADHEFMNYIEELMYNAQVGDAESQNALGELYYYGDELEKDLQTAVFWFKEAAKQSHPEALYNLGICFLNGDGIEQNDKKGTGFIKQAAKMGSENAKTFISGL